MEPREVGAVGGGDPCEDGTGPVSRDQPIANGSATVVLGRYFDYLQAAERVGGRTFNVPKDVWDGMSPEEQWAANQRFLNRAISNGAEFELATPAAAAPEGSFYEREIQYLTSKGYTLARGGERLIPPRQ